MCTVVLRLGADGVCIGANRDEMLARPWQSPGAHWPELPGVIAGRDTLAGGTWLGINSHGVVAAVLNRRGSLGPAPGKRSRGELPLRALAQADAGAAAAAIATLDAGLYRSFNMVIADSMSAFFLRGLETGAPEPRPLAPGVWMITAGEPNEATNPRIARHLPRFEAADFAHWPMLLSDNSGPWNIALNVPPRDGFGTICASVIALPRDGPPLWRFAPGPPDATAFDVVDLSAQAEAASI